LAVSILLVSRQFTDSRFASCVIDDSILQMSWVQQFSRSLQEGILMPRWLPDSNGGYGSPVFIFYSPLVYYVTAPLVWLTQSVVLSMKLVRLAGLFLSGLAMYYFASSLGGRKTGLATALVYVVLPFHVLDVSYWSLYAGTWAWIWFPLILHGARQISSTSSSGILSPVFVLCYGTLVLTHLLSAYLFSFVIGAYCLCLSDRSNVLRNLSKVCANAFAGLALVGFYFLPAIYEQRFVHIEYSTLLPEFDFRNTLLFFPNPDLIASNPFQAKTIGLLQFITLVQGLWILLSLVLRVIDRQEPGYLPLRELAFAMGVAVGCIFLMSSWSIWVWELVPGLPRVQFSTRWLSIYSLVSALLISGGFLTSSSPRWSRTAARLGYLGVAGVSVVFALLIVSRTCFLDQKCEELAAAHVYNAPEYNPKSMVDWKQRVMHPRDPPASLLEGSGEVLIERWTSEDRRIVIDARTPSWLKMRLYPYPGWTMRVDGQLAAAGPQALDGAMTVRVPEGRHDVSLQFQNTWWRTGSLIVSALAAGMMILAAVWKPHDRLGKLISTYN